MSRRVEEGHYLPNSDTYIYMMTLYMITHENTFNCCGYQVSRYSKKHWNVTDFLERECLKVRISV